MQWSKKGLLFCPDGKSTWNQKGYAHVVCADTSYEDKIRLYYSARDEKGRCQASFIDLAPDNISNIIYEHPEPILNLGAPGTFDDCGIMPTWFLQNGDEKWLYYIGWTVRNTIPYHNALGIASSKIRTWFIYISFLTFGSPVIIYMVLAFWRSMKHYILLGKRNPLKY